MKKYEAEALFEVSFSANGSHFLVIYGRHENGGFCCITNWGISCEMGDPNDVFYNTEKLSGAGITWVDAEAVAKVIAQVGAESTPKLRNYGEIKFERDLLKHLPVKDGVTDDGYKYELAITADSNDDEPRSVPLVKYKDRAFILHWKDIVALAEKAELFDDAGGVINALTGKGAKL